MSIAVEQTLVNGQLHILRTQQEPTDSNVPVISMNISILKQDPVRIFDTQEEMEKFCLGYILEHSEQAPNPILEDGRDSDDIRFVFNVASNIPARKSRRGRATRLIHGVPADPVIKQMLFKEKLVIGSLGLMSEYSDFIPNDTMVLIYQGESFYDQAFVYGKDDGKYHLYFDEKSHLYATVLPI